MARRIALVIAALLAGASAHADKLDDAIAGADQKWTSYETLQRKYAELRARWDLIYKPIYDQQKLVDAAKRAMDDACAGEGRATPACNDDKVGATIVWATAVRRRQTLEAEAHERDPKGEIATTALTLLDQQVKQARRDFAAARDGAIKLVTDAKAKAKTKAERDRIDDSLKRRDDRRSAAFRDGRSDRAERSTGGTSTSTTTTRGVGGSAPTTIDPNWDGARKR
jgi:hypothetical protein